MTDEQRIIIEQKAVGIAEGFEGTPEGVDDTEALRVAWQHLIDTGICWRLQGWFGRTAQSLIEQKFVLPYPRKR
tara:strand:- start:1446 stop:1667 length:222 start_codon:yes stop_codon:yes gene_type:complete